MAVKLTKKRTPKQRMTIIMRNVKTRTKPVLLDGIAIRKGVTDGWSKNPLKTKPFINHRPTYFSSQNYKNAVLEMVIRGKSNNAEGANVSVYHLLDQGTKVNYARMSNPFSPKTQPGSLTSSSGVGGFSHLGKAEGGIQAREFDESANFISNPKMIRAINLGFKQGFNAL